MVSMNDSINFVLNFLWEPSSVSFHHSTHNSTSFHFLHISILLSLRPSAWAIAATLATWTSLSLGTIISYCRRCWPIKLIYCRSFHILLSELITTNRIILLLPIKYLIAIVLKVHIMWVSWHFSNVFIIY